MANMEDSSPGDRIRYLSRQLVNGRYLCSMNCYNSLKRKDEIWACKTCYHMFHMKCVQQWALQRAGESAPFCCPQCREQQEPPLSYTCFCGKVKNPPRDPSLTPHTCGKTCEKRRGFCPHPCPLQCHPGPCPPCTAMKEPHPCPCGKSSYTYRCGTEDPRKTCSNICGKLLNCGIHQCPSLCHWGKCDICLKEADVKCDCGKETLSSLCGTSFRCQQECGKPLQCGNHTCSIVCHKGKCPPCPLSPEEVKTCFCGASPILDKRASCTDPIASCGKPCKNLLKCGRHNCTHRCHPGDCPDCSASIFSKCVCGKGGKNMMCCKADEYRCNRPCGNQLSCQRHKCMKKCCPDYGKVDAIGHICNASCDQKLPCGHPCTFPCHRGRCPPCSFAIPTFLTCFCGKTISDPPPLPCGTKSPACPEPCAIPRRCGHPSNDHLCHFGECPPCSFSVDRMCEGKHTIVKSMCGEESAQCDQICGRLLPCGHTCPRKCHGDPCESKPCKLPCGKDYASCHHSCKRPCHYNDPCPKCTHKVSVTCQCGHRMITKKCSNARELYEISGKVSEDSFKGVLECEDLCSNDRFSSLRPTKRVTEESKFIFYEALYDLGMNYQSYLEGIEAKFETLLQQPNEIISLPCAPAEKRKLVHLLASYYRINAQSEDSGEHRSCILTASPYSALPQELLSVQVKNNSNNPKKFMLKMEHCPQNQIFTQDSYKLVVSVLMKAPGCFSFREPKNEKDEVCFFFTTRAARENACSLLRQSSIKFIRGDERVS